MSGTTNKRLVSTVRKASHDVFETMLGLQLQDGEPWLDRAASAPQEGILSLIGLAGAWVGTGTLTCSSESARHVAGRFLMQEFASVDEEVLDALGEITNMIFGNVKTMLEDDLGPMGLSIPTVVYGKNFTTRSVGNRDWVSVPFSMGEHSMEVRICLGQNNRPSASERRAPVLSVTS